VQVYRDGSRVASLNAALLARAHAGAGGDANLRAARLARGGACARRGRALHGGRREIQCRIQRL
jgi:hypothetical protein